MDSSCFTCTAHDCSEWCSLSDGELQRLNDSKRIKEYLPGEIMYHQGDTSDGIYCFRNGLVGMRRIDTNGNSFLLRLSYPGETLGYRALMAGSEHSDSAEVLKPSLVCFIDRDTIFSLLGKNPSLCFRFLSRAAKDAETAEEKYLQNITLTVRARFAHLLLVLQSRYAEASEDGVVFLDLPLSRQDLAAMIGVRPETMSRTIRQFEHDGLAQFSGRTVCLPSMNMLFEEIEAGTDS